MAYRARVCGFLPFMGSLGRPDMALFLFTKSILEGRPIELFNRGQMSRSFTYISDVVRSLIRLIDRVPDKAITHNGLQDIPSLSGSAPFKLHNIGNETVVSLLRYVELLKTSLELRQKKYVTNAAKVMFRQRQQIFSPSLRLSNSHRKPQLRRASPTL